MFEHLSSKKNRKMKNITGHGLIFKKFTVHFSIKQEIFHEKSRSDP